MMTVAGRRQIALLGALVLTAGRSDASDWPQILGPTRNGVAQQQQVRRQWNGAAPRELWTHAVGQGYAGAAVVGQLAILFHRQGDEETVEALDAVSGQPIWRSSWSVSGRPGIDPDSGPRCVPVVEGDAVYLHGITGRLVCLDLQTGATRWQRDTRNDFKFADGYFGVGSSPLLVDDKLIVNVGGRQAAGVVAFSAATGETLWKASEDSASYSSPILAKIDGRSLILVASRLKFSGIDPSSGKVHFEMPFGKRGPTVTAANPVLVGEKSVFLTASYRIGARLVELETGPDGGKATAIWDDDRLMSSQYATSVPGESGTDGVVLFGLDGREDGPPAALKCFDPMTRKIHWTEANFGMATLIRAGNTLLAMKTNGQLVLLDATAAAHRELARFELLGSKTRALPALAGGRLYVRHDAAFKAFDLR